MVKLKRNIKLDAEEKQILRDFEAGKFKSVKNMDEEIQKAINAASITLNKTQNINLRIPFQVLTKIREKSHKNGLPYQTLITAILRQYADDKIKIEL